MSDSCKRCNGAVFAAENPIKNPAGTYHSACFKCNECGTKLILKTAVTKNGESWCPTHVPGDSVDQGFDVKMSNATNAPKQEMGGLTLEQKGAGQGSTYGSGGVAIESQKMAPKPAVTVNNINKMESRNQCVNKFSST